MRQPAAPPHGPRRSTRKITNRASGGGRPRRRRDQRACAGAGGDRRQTADGFRSRLAPPGSAPPGGRALPGDDGAEIDQAYFRSLELAPVKSHYTDMWLIDIRLIDVSCLRPGGWRARDIS